MPRCCCVFFRLKNEPYDPCRILMHPSDMKHVGELLARPKPTGRGRPQVDCVEHLLARRVDPNAKAPIPAPCWSWIWVCLCNRYPLFVVERGHRKGTSVLWGSLNVAPTQGSSGLHAQSKELSIQAVQLPTARRSLTHSPHATKICVPFD